MICQCWNRCFRKVSPLRIKLNHWVWHRIFHTLYSSSATPPQKTHKKATILVRKLVLKHESHLDAKLAHLCVRPLKGWVQVNELRLSRASIYIEDTTTSTCWGSKCLWSQLFSFLLNLWVLPLVAFGTWETQGLRETMTLLCDLLGGCQGQALGGSRTKTSHSRQSVMRANNQGEKCPYI